MCWNIIADNLGNIAAISLALAAIFTLFVTIYINFLRKPKFSIEFEQKEPFCRFSKTPIGQNRFRDGYWIRIRVKNIGKTTAHKCVGKLIEIRDSNGNLVKSFDPVILHWVCYPGKVFEPIDLGRSDYEYLDVVWTEQGFDIAMINCDRRPRGILFDLPPGDYELTIMIVGDNANAVPKIFRLSWNGVWNQIKMEPK